MKYLGAVDDPKDLTTKEYVDAADAALSAQVDELYDAIFRDITGNPFVVTFTSLDGVTVITGVWNTSSARLEC